MKKILAIVLVLCAVLTMSAAAFAEQSFDKLTLEFVPSKDADVIIVIGGISARMEGEGGDKQEHISHSSAFQPFGKTQQDEHAGEKRQVQKRRQQPVHLIFSLVNPSKMPASAQASG